MKKTVAALAVALSFTLMAAPAASAQVVNPPTASTNWWYCPIFPRLCK